MNCLISEIEKIAKPYYDKNDLGHGWDHAIEVMNLALKINKETELSCNENDVIAASLLHDIGVSIDRKTHHIVAFNMLFTDELFKWFDALSNKYNIDWAAVLLAIVEHRASFTGEYSSKLSELISSADRLYPDEEQLIKRMILCFSDFEMGYKKIQDKYIKGGYARYPQMYIDYFGKQFERFQEVLSDKAYVLTLYIRN